MLAASVSSRPDHGGLSSPECTRRSGLGAHAPELRSPIRPSCATVRPHRSTATCGWATTGSTTRSTTCCCSTNASSVGTGWRRARRRFLVGMVFRHRVRSLDLDGMAASADLLSTFDVDEIAPPGAAVPDRLPDDSGERTARRGVRVHLVGVEFSSASRNMVAFKHAAMCRQRRRALWRPLSQQSASGGFMTMSLRANVTAPCRTAIGCVPISLRLLGHSASAVLSRAFSGGFMTMSHRASVASPRRTAFGCVPKFRVCPDFQGRAGVQGTQARPRPATDLPPARGADRGAHLRRLHRLMPGRSTLKNLARPRAPGLTPRAVLEKFANGPQVVDVHLPTTDGATWCCPATPSPRRITNCSSTS